MRHVHASGSAVADELAFRPSLLAFVERQLADRQDSDDIVQETYVRLYGHRLDTAIEDVKAFCFAVARNLIRDRFRGRARSACGPVPEDLACPLPAADEILAYRRAVALLAACLTRMPPLRREVFLRKRLDGCSTATIATDLEMSLAAVEKHVVRALRDLRVALAQHGFTMSGGA